MGKIMKKKGFMKLVVANLAVATTCVGFTGCLDDVKGGGSRNRR